VRPAGNIFSGVWRKTVFRLRVFGIVDSLDRGTISTATAADLFQHLEEDVATLVAAS
jgi:hypothetical protein